MRVAAALLVASTAACGSSATQPVHEPTEGGSAQQGAGDGAPDDGQAGDTGSGDAGPTDSSSVDATGAVQDTGARDAGAQDAGVQDAGGADGGAARCKRGIAANAAPTAPFAPTGTTGIAWWYNWSSQQTGGDPRIEFVPMLWGGGSLGASIPAGTRNLLGFNEPNFKAQANLTSAQAAADWPQVEAKAGSGVSIVGPGVNFCGSASNPSQCTDPAVTDPYTYLKDFFAACPGCRVDYVAVHWYNCDLPSLRAYIEGNTDAGGGLQGFVQFGNPIWVTEFACDGSHTVADQTAYMQAAVPYLENNPHVARYAWFSASNIPNALLANANGSLTALGSTYVGLPETCR
jgi:hypothetical protein